MTSIQTLLKLWNNIFNSPSYQLPGVRELISQKADKQVIKSQSSLNEIKEEEKMKAAINKYLEVGNVQLETQDGGYLRDFWLPLNNEANEGKFVIFSSTAGWNSYVHYGTSTLTLRKNDKLVFICNNGKWVEYSDMLFSKIKYGDGFWSMKVPVAAMLAHMWNWIASCWLTITGSAIQTCDFHT